MALPSLHLDSKLEPALASGHPWVYRNHLPKHALKGGEWVRVQAGQAEAYGLYDAQSAVAVRLFSPQPPTRGLITQRVREALALRARLFGGDETTCYRLLYGEGDYLPGVVADLYERYAVVQLHAASVEAVLPEVVNALKDQLKLRGVLTRREGELEALWGQLPPPEVTVRENGLGLLANLYQGQKTGLFLDQRDNRARLGKLTAGENVLNLFSYTGGFSLYAARGGAKRVTSVDSSKAATEDARRSFALNGFDPLEHAFIAADAFELLATYAHEGRRFGVVVLDPPSLAKAKKSRYAALRAYLKLNALALRCVAPGGLLASSSCTAQVSAEDFRGVLAEAAASTGRRAQIIHEAGHAADHPVPLSFPEGRYLKFVVLRLAP